MRSLITFSMLLLFVLPATAFEAAIVYKNVPLGSTHREFLKNNKEFKCNSNKSARITCTSSDSTTYAGLLARKASAEFIEDRLSLVDVSIYLGETDKQLELNSKSAFATLVSALRLKYGPPEFATEALFDGKRTTAVWEKNKETIQAHYWRSDSKTQEPNAMKPSAGVMIYRNSHWEDSIRAGTADAAKDL